MEGYENIGLCRYIINSVKNGAPTNLYFYDIDKSLLVVAEKVHCIPIALFIDDRCENPQADLSEAERQYGRVCCSIAEKANLPLLWIRYSKKTAVLENNSRIYICECRGQNMEFENREIREIVDIFRRRGVNCALEDKSPQKRKNDSLSSAFHLWQREHLKLGIFSDLDLVRINNHNEVTEILELKRSLLSLNDWRPFEADYNNFRIVYNLSRLMGGIPFKIIFNTQVSQITNQKLYYKTFKMKSNALYYDIVDTLSVFDVTMKDSRIAISEKKIITAKDFIGGIY